MIVNNRYQQQTSSIHHFKPFIIYIELNVKAIIIGIINSIKAKKGGLMIFF